LFITLISSIFILLKWNIMNPSCQQRLSVIGVLVWSCSFAARLQVCGSGKFTASKSPTSDSRAR
jgi:hypothetical protein